MLITLHFQSVLRNEKKKCSIHAGTSADMGLIPNSERSLLFFEMTYVQKLNSYEYSCCSFCWITEFWNLILQKKLFLLTGTVHVDLQASWFLSRLLLVTISPLTPVCLIVDAVSLGTPTINFVPFKSLNPVPYFLISKIFLAEPHSSCNTSYSTILISINAKKKTNQQFGFFFESIKK